MALRLETVEQRQKPEHWDVWLFLLNMVAPSSVYSPSQSILSFFLRAEGDATVGTQHVFLRL